MTNYKFVHQYMEKDNFIEIRSKTNLAKGKRALCKYFVVHKTTNY